jgi:hypothetical protein
MGKMEKAMKQTYEELQTGVKEASLSFNVNRK